MEKKPKASPTANNAAADKKSTTAQVKTVENKKTETADEKEKKKKATPIEPYKGNSKLQDRTRLTASGMKGE